MNKVYTSEDILESMDQGSYEFLENGVIKYQMTKGEMQWLKFVTNRYSIADLIWDNLDDDIVTLDTHEFSQALDNDNQGSGKATCLSDDSALQAIFFVGYIP